MKIAGSLLWRFASRTEAVVEDMHRGYGVSGVRTIRRKDLLSLGVGSRCNAESVVFSRCSVGERAYKSWIVRRGEQGK